jgi:hypothetical protein
MTDFSANSVNDTSPWAEKIIIEGYRSMSPVKKLQQVVSLTQAAQKMALTRIREHYGEMSNHEENLRLASLWLSRETMIKLFNWDPLVKGY